MTDLIARLEAAEEGNSELDAEIWLLVEPGATRKKWSYVHTKTGNVCHVDETRDASGEFITVPSYTTSLDAALSLVPSGWDWSRDVSGEVTVWGRKEDRPKYWTYNAQTAPLSLCAAILRAREAEKE